MGHIYTKKLPGLLIQADSRIVLIWDTTVFTLRIFGATILALISMSLFVLKTNDWRSAIWLSLVIPVSAVGAFTSARCVVTSRFDTLRDISIAQSFLKLISIPGAYFLGVTGWLMGHIISAMALFGFRSVRKKLHDLYRNLRLFDYTLIREHISEAIVLCLIGIVWIQLMTSSRLSAILYFSDETIAHYGLASGIYQLGTAIIIAAFTPQTVIIYKLFSKNHSEGIKYAFKISSIGVSTVLLVSIVAVLLAPPLLAIIYPTYGLSESMIQPLILSVVSVAVVSVFGSVFIGSGMSFLYLIILAMCFAFSLFLTPVLKLWFAQDSAAIAQLMMLSSASLTLVSISLWKYRSFLKGEARLISITTLAPFIAGLFVIALRTELV